MAQSNGYTIELDLCGLIVPLDKPFLIDCGSQSLSGTVLHAVRHLLFEWSRGMLKLSKFGSGVKHLNYGFEDALASGRDRFQYEP